jgi:PIN domain nuclease of toxin-antitoxin system
VGGVDVILLDTHVVLWWQAGGDRLSATAQRTIAASGTILVSPVSFWEITLLAMKGRIELDRDMSDWVHDFLQTDRVGIAGLTPTAAVAAARLPLFGFPGDPADGFLYATARERDVPFLTKDERIRAHAQTARDLRVVW